MKKFIIILLVMMSLVGCSKTQEKVRRSGLEIYSCHTSIGAVKGSKSNYDKQSFEYSIVITNNDLSDLRILSVEPLLSSKFSNKVIEQETIIDVDKVISSGESIELNGEIIFDASGLTKEEILDIAPFIKDIKVREERIIKVR